MLPPVPWPAWNRGWTLGIWGCVTSKFCLEVVSFYFVFRRFHVAKLVAETVENIFFRSLCLIFIEVVRLCEVVLFSVWKKPFVRHAQYPKILSVSFLVEWKHADSCDWKIFCGRGIKYSRFLMRQQIKSERSSSRALLEFYRKSSSDWSSMRSCDLRGSDLFIASLDDAAKTTMQNRWQQKYGRLGGWKGTCR